METALYSVTLVVVIIIHYRNINVLVRTFVVDGWWRVKDRLDGAGRLEALDRPQCCPYSGEVCSQVAECCSCGGQLALARQPTVANQWRAPRRWWRGEGAGPGGARCRAGWGRGRGQLFRSRQLPPNSVD